MNMHKKLILALCITVMPVGVCLAEVASDTLNLGIFPRRNPILTTRMFLPLVKYLSEKLGIDVVLDTPKDFETFWNKVKNNEYDIVHFNQYHYVKSHKEFGYKVIAKNIEFNEATIAGAIIVRKDSNLKSVMDLKGRKVVFGGGPRAMQSYIVARYLLQTNGLNHGEYEESFATNPPNSILSAYFKQSDAAGAGDKVLQLNIVTSQIDVDEMKYLVRGEQLAHLPWAVNRKMNSETTRKLVNILLNLDRSDKGKAILRKLRLSGFSAAADEDYDKHRMIIEAVLHETY
jgi:phosphonate transport system substrate-binding protein